MLTIRSTQIQELDRDAAERFVAVAEEHLLRHYPGPSERLGGPEAVQAFVRRGIERARQNRVETRGAVVVLLELWIQFGEQFERSPIRQWTANFLSHPELPGEIKAEVIRDRHRELTGGCVLMVF